MPGCNACCLLDIRRVSVDTKPPFLPKPCKLVSINVCFELQNRRARIPDLITRCDITSFCDKQNSIKL